MAVRHIFTRPFGPQGGFETHQMVSPPTSRDGVVVGFVEKLTLNLVYVSKKEGKAEKYAFAHFPKTDGNFRNFQKWNLLSWLVSGHNNNRRLGSFSRCRISTTLASYQSTSTSKI